LGKGKKIGIGVGLGILGFFIFALVAGTMMFHEEEQELRNTAIEEEQELRFRSIEELEKLSVSWEYDDILRNIEYYEGKIIHIEGSIITTEYVSGDRYALLVGIDCKPRPDNLDCNDMVIGYNGKKLLKDDKIEAWIIVDKIAEVKTDSGEYELMPVVEAIKVNCLTCPE